MYQVSRAPLHCCRLVVVMVIVHLVYLYKKG